MRLIKYIISAVIILLLPFPSSAENFIKYDVTGHPKSQGLSFSIKYPSSWTPKEGDRPHIVKKFIDESGGNVQNSCLISVNEVYQIAPTSDMHKITSKYIKDSLSRSFSRVEVSDFKKVTIEGERAILYIYSATLERLGVNVYMKSRALILQHKNKVITIQCASAGDLNIRYKIDNIFNKRDRAVNLIILNSLILNDKYR